MNTLKAILSLIIILSGTFQNINCQDSLVLQPGASEGKDAYIEDWPEANYSNRNFGTHTEFQASAWTAQGIPLVVRGLIEFDLSQIPANAFIAEAKLYLYSVGNTVNGPGHSPLSGSNACYLQRVTSAWDEMEVTWNTQPVVTTKNQVLIEASDSALQDYVIDVGKLVQDMIDEPETAHGFMFRIINESYYRKMLFASSDYEDESFHPKLIVIYFDEVHVDPLPMDTLSYLDDVQDDTITNRSFSQLIQGALEDTLIEKELNSDFRYELFPNPNYGKFTLRLEHEPDNEVAVEVYSINGKLLNSYLIKNMITEFDLSFYRNNMFIFVLKREGEIYTEQLVKIMNE